MDNERRREIGIILTFRCFAKHHRRFKTFKIPQNKSYIKAERAALGKTIEKLRSSSLKINSGEPAREEGGRCDVASG